jgi:hypothetical protein
VRPRLDHPAVPAVIALLTATVFVTARLVFAAHGDITRFLVVGSANLAPHGLPAGIHVFAGSGYDGQFYYRQALDPFTVARVADGIRLDGLYRLQRVGYPLIAFALAGGHKGLVPDSLVAVNVLGLGVLGYLGGVIAHDAKRHACSGLLLAGYFGFVTTLARDLLEIVAASFLLAAIVAYRRGRHLLAGIALAGDVLTKETDMFIVGAYAAVVVISTLASRGRVSPPSLSRHLTWLVPTVAFVGLQLALYRVLHTLALTSGAQGNFGVPFEAPVEAVDKYLAHPTTLANAVWFGELAVLSLVVLVALVTIARTSARVEERLALLVLIGLTVSLSTEVWYGQADFRALAPLFELAAIVLLGSRLRLGILYAAVGAAFLVTYVHRVAFI